MYLQVKASSLDLQMPTRGRVAPQLAGVQDRKHLAAPCKKWTNPHRYTLKI